MAKKSYDKMTAEELDQEVIRLSNEEAPKAERRAAVDAYNKKASEEEMLLRFGVSVEGDVSDELRETIARMVSLVSLKGLPSDEAG